jgi:hypothetical protein
LTEKPRYKTATDELAEIFLESAFSLLESLSNSIKAQEAIEEICPSHTDIVLNMIQKWNYYRIKDNEQWVQSKR